MTNPPANKLSLLKSILGDDYLALRLRHLTIVEQVDKTCTVTFETVDSNNLSQTVSGNGRGMVDAVLEALHARYAGEYRSLDSVELSNFRVEGLRDPRQHRGGDAKVTVIIDVVNGDGAHFSFSDESRSMVSSSARAALAMVEYFINAERAYIHLYNACEDAKTRALADLVALHTRQMAELDSGASYTAIIESASR